jgi:CheY-like chemotaxis protein
MELEHMLQSLGCDVVGSASSVPNALAVIGKCKLDGALLDMNLRGEGILPVAEKLLEKGVPFLLVTGYASSTGDHTLLKDAPRLNKPFSIRSLGAAMLGAFFAGVQTPLHQ